MKNLTLFSVETRFKDRFYCCIESLKGNLKFLLVFVLFMGSFTQGVSAQGTLVPSCNLIGPLEACAVSSPLDTSGDIIINIEVARSGAPNLNAPNDNANFVYTFPSNTAGAFIRTFGNIVYNPVTNRTTQTLVVFPGSSTPEFNLQLNATNTTSVPSTVCECSKSVSVSRVAVTSSYSPITCFGQMSTLTAVGQFSDINQYTYTLLPSGPSNATGIFPGLPGSEAGITYTINCESAEGCVITTSQTITQPAFNPVILNCPETITTALCLTQDAVNSAFNAWLNSFSYTGGTSPVLTRSPEVPVAPSACGGITTVTWTVNDRCGEPQTCTRTFTVPTPPAVIVNGPASSSTNACLYTDQAAANAAFTTWLAGFTVSGGCAPVGTYGQPQAPAYCGGTTTVTYNVSDRCYPGSTITRTFTITPAPAVVINGPISSSTNACSYADQDAANAAFATWLAGFTVSGGCAPVGTYGQPVAPPYCGGTTSVTYTVSDRCYAGASITRVFIITPAPAVVVNGSANSTTNACSYADQAAANAAFTAWLAGFTVSGGCAPFGSFGEGTPQAPAYCGGTTTVTYSVFDKCYDTTRLVRTFTITPAPAVVVNSPENSSSNACSYADQAAANAAFTAWLAGFTVSGGCAPVGTYGQPTPPAYCGGTTSVTYTVSDKCYQGSTVTRTFTITPAPAVVANGPENSITNACSYADQAAADAAYTAWLNSFTVSGGCAPVGNFTSEQTPPAYCGGTRTVTYVVADRCYAGTSITRTFTITPAPAVVANGPANSTSNACSYADQAAANAAFATWLAGFTVSGGCSPVGSFGEGTPSAPAYCGGTRTITYTVSDKCYAGTTITRTFTITPAPAVVVNSPENSTSSACSYADQAAADAAYAAWLNSFTVSGGCAPVGGFTNEQTPPAYCGGTRTVTYVVADKCYQGTSITRTFTITAAPAVVANGPENSISNACSYADQAAANAAFSAWLTGFTVSGGCAPVGTYGQPVAPPYCGGVTTVTYTVSDKCYQGTTITATFTITPAPAVVVNGPANATAPAGSYADQAAADAAFAAWLAQFTVSGGCAPVGSYGQPSAPYYCGGTVEVTYTVTDKCYVGTTITRTFTITPSNPPVVNGPENSSTNACIYADQAAANAAFAAWLAQFTVSGGINPSGSFGEGTPSAPQYCGGTTIVTYTVTDRCHEPIVITRTFTITPAPAVVVNGPENSTSNACSYADQAAADAAFATWLAQFTVGGGCAPVGVIGIVGAQGIPSAPAYCGGTITVSYSVIDKCYQGSFIVRTFTITPAPAVVANSPENSTSNACSYADQAAANAAFTAWLAGFTVSGGCAPVGSFGEGTPSAPAYCGGTTTVVYAVSDKCYEGTRIVRTFTITPAPAVIAHGSENSTSNACSYADQAAANAAFTAWLAGFNVSGGCSPVGSFGEGTPSAPAYCGGTTTVTYTVSDKCYQGISFTATFTITPAPAVVANGPENSTSNACSYADQAAANAAFAAWLAGFNVSGGCAPVGSFGEGTPSAPAYCGGTVTVTYSVTDKCYQGTLITRTFTITPAPAVIVNGAENSTASSCTYADQAAVNAAFTAWLAGFNVSGGCAPVGSFGEGTPQAPALCGGSTTVTYNVSDKCYQGATRTATFTITAPAPVVINAANNATYSACAFANQDAANAAFATWLTNITVSGGCAPVVTAQGHPVAPSACGGSVCVTFLVTDKCYTGSVTQVFTITPAPAVVVTQAENSTSNACSYADQAAANAAFTAWLAGFTVSGGCAPTGSFGEGTPSAPAYCGGTTTVTYTVSDRCYQGSTVTRTFTITPAPAVVVNGPENSTTNACSYANQAAADAAYAAWLNSFTVSGGCAPVGGFTNEQTPPAYCGGTRTVTYVVADKCYQGTSITRTFTITPAPAVVVNGSANSTSNACSYANQAAANAAFTAWLAGFTVSGGCAPVGSFGEGTPQAPAYCGGTTTVVYAVSDKCYDGTRIVRTFTITPAPAVVVNAPENSTSNACSYADQAAADAAYAAWLNSFTVSGGCAPVGGFTNEQTPPAYCGGTRTVTYVVADKCYQGTSITRTFTITAAPAVVANGPENSISNACSYADQAAANAAFSAWLTGFTVSGGCAPVGTYGQPVAPPYCGGVTTVTYTVSDKCYQGTTITATFTITPAPAVVVNGPANATAPAGSYADQAAADAAFAAWLAQFTVSGGCAPVGSYGQPSAPYYCGGTVEVTYTVTDKCYVGTTITRTFTITPSNPPVVNGPENSSTNACIYADQAAANAAFAAWLAQFTVSGGINPSGSFGEGTPSAPQYCGGTTIVTYTVTDRCHEPIVITRTFTITPAPAVVVNGPENSTSNACSYADQAAADAAFATWLAQFTVGGGCAPVGVIGIVGAQGIPSAPAYCGGTITVSYSVIDKCYQGSFIVRTFTITPAPAVVANSPENSTSNACSYADQAAANAAFTAWLAGFTVSGGCAPVGSFGEGTPSAPAYCGGTTTVVYAVSDKCYEGTRIVRTFTITPAPAVIAHGSENSTSNACSYADQAAANAAFTAWLAGFNVSGGCSPVGSFGEGTPSAPAYCGGTTTVTYTVSDKCYQGISFTATFTITPAPAVVANGPENSTSNACSYADQAAANAAFAAWLAGFNVSGGCAPVGSFGEGTPSAPAYCGGTVTVTYSVTDKCYQGTLITRTFTITPAPAVIVNGAENSTASSCTYADQAAVNAAFTAWLAGFNVSGGCAPVGSFGEGTPQAPALCGGSTTVTYNVSDKCYQGATRTATFTITAPAPVVINAANNATYSACAFANQDAANAAFATWLTNITVSGGCAPVVTAQGHPVAPSACGGSVCVTFLVTDKCYTGSVTQVFTITPAPAVVVTQAENSTSNACSYADQAAANAAFTAWLAGFTVSGGCAPTGSFGEGTPSAPAYCGGTTTVTYTVSDRCYQGSTVTRTFTITPAPAVVVNGPENSTTNACSYANQAAADAAYAAWLNSFTVSGGCAPVGGFTNEQTPPAYCGGTRTVTYVVADKCYQGTSITRTFTITPAPAVVVNGSANSTSNACSYANQAAANAAFTAWLAGFTVSGGCAPVGSFGEGTPQAPAYCGGTTTVTYSVTDKCYQGTPITRTFTINAAPAVVFNCGSDVTVQACSTQSQVTAAWNAFLNSTTASGGCNGSLTRTSATAPSICGGSASITWTYTVGSCGTTQSCTRTFTVAAPAPVVLTCGSNVTLPACSTQAQLNAAWTAFLNSTTATGGCGGVLTRTSCSAPSLCGGYVDVTWTYTVASCGPQSGCGSTNSVHCTKRFTIAAPAQVAISCGSNVTLQACSTQAQLTTAWNAFLASTTASGGCNGVLTRTQCSAPSLCGGYVDVTWTYTVGSCGQQSGCGSSNTVSCTRRFTVAAPPQVVFNCGTNVTVGACKTQAQVNSAWTAFLNSTTASGGCGGVLTNNAPAQAPSVCGGYVDVTWIYTVASCGQQSGCGTGNSLTCTKRFTVTGTSAVAFNCGTDVTVPACSSQTTVNNAWYAFLASTTASGGCNGVFSRTSPTTPSSCGGSVDVTWTYTTTACGGQTSTQTCTKTFTVAAPAQVVLTPGANVTLPACSTQAQLNTAWTAFLNSTTGTGGCGGVLTRTSCSAPSLCGGYVDVTWTYTVATCGQSSGCGSNNTSTQSQSITRRFTVATPSPLTFNAGNNVTVPACSTQAQLTAAWNTFLASTTVTGGCNATLTRTSCSAPSLCGGYVDVTWTATTASCGQQSGCGTGNSQSITRRFTVSAPSQVIFNCGSNVTLSGSSTQAQITAAWNTFLNSTTASGGCGAVLTRTSAAMPTECGEYADVTWTYTVASCGQQSGCGSTNQMTCTKRFAIGGGSTSVTINVNNVTVPSCKTQAQVNALWASFLTSATVSGGSGTLTNNGASRTIPSACGGYADVTWTYTGGCGQTIVTCGGQTTTVSGTYTVTRRFTVTSGGGVDVAGPSNVSYANTSFNSQYAVNSAFATWLAQFRTISSGCGSTAVFSGSNRVAPSWTTGGTVSVTYSITGNCNSDSVCATFTITRTADCKITPAAEVRNDMTAKAYPNPFSENFNLDLTTSSIEKVGVAIYDMTGKLIEQREINADEVSGLQIGDRYASGVYNVIVTQGSEVKTLRVIKR
jgi:hypothetical protein